jgi:hypothetical protein
MMHPFHSNLPRRVWQSPSFLKPSLPGKRPSSLPRSSAFSASAPRKVTVCRHAARETDPAGQSTPNQYSTSLCKVQSGYVRNPDGWLTGRCGPKGFTGSYRDISTSLRLAIASVSASRYPCRHSIRVSPPHTSTRSCHSLVSNGTQPFFFPYVHSPKPGCCIARPIAENTMRIMLLRSSYVDMKCKSLASRSDRRRNLSAPMMSLRSSWTTIPILLFRIFATSG